MIYGIVGTNLSTITENYELAKALKDQTTFSVMKGFKTRKEAEQFLWEHRRNEYIKELKSDTFGYHEKEMLNIKYKTKYDKIIVSVTKGTYSYFEPWQDLRKIKIGQYKMQIEGIEGNSLKQEVNRITRVIKAIPEKYNLQIECSNISIPLAITKYVHLYPAIGDLLSKRKGTVCFLCERKYDE